MSAKSFGLTDVVENIDNVVKAPKRLLVKDDEPSEPEYITSGSESAEPEYISSESEIDRERNRVLDSLEA